MAGFTLAAAADILQTDYQDGLRDQLNNENILMAQLEKKIVEHRGDTFYLALHRGRNEGSGTRGEDANLPDPGKQQYAQATYSRTHQYLRIRLTGQVIEATRGSRKSFADALDTEVRRGGDDISRDTNRMLWNDGSGFLTKTQSNTTVEDIKVDSAKFLEVGQKIQIRNRTDGDFNATLSGTDGTENLGWISAVDKTSSPNTFKITDTEGGTVDTSVTTATTEGVHRYQSVTDGGAAPASTEINGLANLIKDNTATVGGLARASNSWWQTVQVTDLASNPWGVDLEDKLQELIDELAIKGGKPNLIITSHAQRRVLVKQLQTLRQFTTDKMDLKAGHKAIMWDDMPIAVDRDATIEHGETMLGWYAMDTTHLMVIQTGEWKWIDEDGSMFYRTNGGDRDALGATFRKYYNVATDRSNALGFMSTPVLANA